jgi:hypothetical protein
MAAKQVIMYAGNAVHQNSNPQLTTGTNKKRTGNHLPVLFIRLISLILRLRAIFSLTRLTLFRNRFASSPDTIGLSLYIYTLLIICPPLIRQITS